MKRFIVFIGVAFAFVGSQAQNIADFENLTVPESGYFIGETEHSGTLGNTETIRYQSGAFEFEVQYTPEDGYDWWYGMAYTNQTDLSTADWTNFSAYSDSPNGGGYNGSQNYATVYIMEYFSEQIEIALMEGYEDLSINGLYVTNHVWAYHYINGSDGSSEGYQKGDYYKLIFSDETNNTIEFYLADFTADNNQIIDDWTLVDLSTLQGSKFYIAFESSDDWTPSYFCIDHIIAETTTQQAQQTSVEFAVYPNPASNILKLQNVETGTKVSVLDISGRLLHKTEITNSQSIDISFLSKGVYFIQELSNGKTQKFIKQ